MAVRKLNHREELFVFHYLRNGGVAAQAARDAGYAEFFATQASKWVSNSLMKPHVYEAVHGAREQLAKELTRRMDLTVTPERIQEEYAKLAFANIGNYVRVQADGTAVIDLNKADEEQLAALTEIQVDEYMDGRGEDARPVKRVKIKMTDKKTALDSLARIHSMFKDRAELSGTVTLMGILKEIEEINGGTPLIPEATLCD